MCFVCFTTGRWLSYCDIHIVLIWEKACALTALYSHTLDPCQIMPICILSRSLSLIFVPRSLYFEQFSVPFYKSVQHVHSHMLRWKWYIHHQFHVRL